MMVCLFIFISILFQPFLQSRKFVVEVVEALQLQIVADATTVRGDGLIVRDAVKTEQLLQAGEVGIGNAYRLFIGQPRTSCKHRCPQSFFPLQ